MPLPLPSALYPVGVVCLALPDSDELLLLAPATLEVVDRLRAPAPVVGQAWDARGMTLALLHPAGSAHGGAAAFSLLDFARGRAHGPFELPIPLQEMAHAPVALDGTLVLADRPGRSLLMLSASGGDLRVRSTPLPLEPVTLARSLDGVFLAVGGAPGEGIAMVEPESGAVIARWGAAGAAEGLLSAPAPGPSSGVWLMSEAATGAVLLVAPGAAQPVKARWQAPGPAERGKLPRVAALVSTAGSALVWALYGPPGAPVGVAVFDVEAGRQVAWRRRMGGNLPLDLTELALDPLGRCLYAVRASGDACELLVMTPLMTRVSARLPMSRPAAGVTLSVRPRLEDNGRRNAHDSTFRVGEGSW